MLLVHRMQIGSVEIRTRKARAVEDRMGKLRTGHFSLTQRCTAQLRPETHGLGKIRV